MARHWIYLRLIQILLDAVGIYVAFLVAYFLRVGWIFSTDFAFLPYAVISLVATSVWMGFLCFTKYYRVPPRSGQRRLFDISLAFLGGITANAMMLIVFLFNVEVIFSRAITLYAFLLGSAFLMVTQVFFLSLLRRFKHSEKHIYRTLIIGANRVAQKLIHQIQTNAYAPYKILGVIDPYGLASDFDTAPILGKLDRLEDVCRDLHVTAIIQCDGYEHTLNLISFCDEKKIKFQFDPALRGIFEQNLRIREVAGVALISFVQRDYSGMKRTQFRLVDWILRQIFDVD